MKFATITPVFLLSILLTIINAADADAQSIAAKGYNFTATQKIFTYLSGGTSINAIEVDDDYTTIPIGFTFRFCGADFNDVTVCSNGWIRFGTGAGTAVANWNYNATPNSGIEPAVYAFYEDVSGVGGESQYVVSGTAPNRIFKWECRDWLWDYAASSASISFQVWLYEATGEIECLYKQESGAVSVGTSGGATIGIGNSSTDWQVLDGTGANPISSSTTYTANLTTRPATGQSYMWDPGPKCNTVNPINIGLVNSTVVEFSWAGVPSSMGYEYVVDMNASGPALTSTPVSTTATSATVINLTPSTQYYIHVRNKCGTYNYSPWITEPVLTLQPCIVPPVLQVPQLDYSSATISWTPIVTALEYEYTLKQDNNTPVFGDPTSITNNNSVQFTGLTSGETYYFFVRAKCSGMDSSAWVTDSVYVPIPCREPVIAYSDINTSRAVVYWPAPETAYKYEIINSTTPLSNPTVGTEIFNNSYLIPFLDPNTQYYTYVKAHCDDRGVLSTSDWSNATFSTWAVSVENVEGSGGHFMIYPNPAGNEVTVIKEKTSGVNALLSITDITGKLVYSSNMPGDKEVVNIHHLPQGIYIVKYSDGSGTQQIKLNKQ